MNKTIINFARSGSHIRVRVRVLFLFFRHHTYTLACRRATEPRAERSAFTSQRLCKPPRARRSFSSWVFSAHVSGLVCEHQLAHYSPTRPQLRTCFPKRFQRCAFFLILYAKTITAAAFNIPDIRAKNYIAAKNYHWPVYIIFWLWIERSELSAPGNSCRDWRVGNCWQSHTRWYRVPGLGQKLHVAG